MVGIDMTDSMLRVDDEAEGFLGMGMLEDRPGRLAMMRREIGQYQHYNRRGWNVFRSTRPAVVEKRKRKRGSRNGDRSAGKSRAKLQ